MGAVHGVYLKYVGLSAASYAGLRLVLGGLPISDSTSSALPLLTGGVIGGGVDVHRILSTSSGSTDGSLLLPLGMYLRLGVAAALGYSTLLNGTIACLFKLERGMGMIGKDRVKGTIPAWSYAVLWPFHLPTMLYTYVHTRKGSMKATQSKKPGNEREKVPVASEVQPGWWVGGCYSHELNKDWAAIVDLTVEFPERCISRTDGYLCLPTWDGVPCSPAQLEQAATFCADARAEADRRIGEGETNVSRDVLVHCAHGRGRSTTVMCAAMVRAGLYATWEEAFEKGIRPGRPVCKLNRLMRTALTEWQKTYVDGKKGA